MPHSEATRCYCKSMARLSSIVDKFVSQDSDQGSMEGLLQKCIDTLSNYQEECKKLKKLKETHFSQEEIFQAHESAYVYYKIVSQIVLNKIPNLEQFVRAKSAESTKKDRDLIEIYNMLVKRLLNDEKIGDIKKFIKEHSKGAVTEPGRKNSIGQDIRNGQTITCQHLQNLMAASSVLLIDLRPRIEFIKSHIKSPSVICIEPISFKDTYSDLDLAKKSMITSPNCEIELFSKRDTFQFIVLYTHEDGRTQYYKQQQMKLLDLLLSRSFDKPLDKVKVLILEGGFEEWLREIGDCETSRNKDDGIYTDGDISGLNLQHMTTKTNSYDQSFQPMLSRPSTVTNGNLRSTHFFPDQQKPVLKRSSSFKDYFANLSPSTSSHRSTSSPPPSKFSAAYPETPNLMGDNSHPRSLPQISPIQSRALTPLSRTLSPQHPINGHSSSNLTLMLSQSKQNPDPKTVSLQQQHQQQQQQQQHQHQQQLQQQQQQQQQQRLLPPLSQHSQSQTLIQSPRASAQYDLDFSVGLVNLGNSCYMNCIIQCLLGTHELSQMFLNDSYKNHINFNSKLGSKGVLAKYFSQLVHNMYQQNTPTSSFSSKKKLFGDERNAVQPLNFKIACGTINSLFRDCSQQDCQEFCQFLLDGLHEDLNQCGGNPRLKELSEEAEKIREKLSMRIASSIEWERYLTTDFSVIVDLFQGQYASQLKCQVCGRTSTTYQPFSVLSVPLPSLKSCNILDCFQEFTKVETLEKDEQWSCPDCKKRQPSTKKITITRLPRNLIIHLKRFDNMMNKNNVFVSYPHTLDLTPFWANDFDGRLPPGVTELPTRGQVPPFSYKLYAVASHTGTLYGGHYTAYVHKGSQRGWCYFDDTNWRRSRSDNECITSNAYVLFYHRVYGT